MSACASATGSFGQIALASETPETAAPALLAPLDDDIAALLVFELELPPPHALTHSDAPPIMQTMARRCAGESAWMRIINAFHFRTFLGGRNWAVTSGGIRG
jgi:hypothetical protein